MSQTADRLARLVAATPLRLADISDAEAAEPRAAGAWSKKQIIGHLIDSASNCQHRWVRAQLAGSLEFPGYEQEGWVAVQSYATESWPDLVNLWLLFNRHLLHILKAMPESALACPCSIGGEPPVPLSEVIEGYLNHLEHHLHQVLR